MAVCRSQPPAAGPRRRARGEGWDLLFRGSPIALLLPLPPSILPPLTPTAARWPPPPPQMSPPSTPSWRRWTPKSDAYWSGSTLCGLLGPGPPRRLPWQCGHHVPTGAVPSRGTPRWPGCSRVSSACLPGAPCSARRGVAWGRVMVGGWWLPCGEDTRRPHTQHSFPTPSTDNQRLPGRPGRAGPAASGRGQEPDVPAARPGAAVTSRSHARRLAPAQASGRVCVGAAGGLLRSKPPASKGCCAFSGTATPHLS